MIPGIKITSAWEKIMEEEKFTELEKTMVNHLTSTADRVKIISEIKIAKSNERHAAAANGFTYILVITAIMGLVPNNPYSWEMSVLVVGLILGALFISFRYRK